MISFIIPAHNEERCLPVTLDALLGAIAAVGRPAEVIVVDDASTDRTGEIARARGVRVIEVAHRHIASTRNAGARAAVGDIFMFVDADTTVDAGAIREALAAMEAGAIGGGCHFKYDGPIPVWAHVLLPIGNMAGRLLKVAGGAFVFCRREGFEAAGGFPEAGLLAEDVDFVKALKRRGRFVIPAARVVTSNRKLAVVRLVPTLRLIWRFAFRGSAAFQDREELGLWYGPEARGLPRPEDRADR